jgi:hypothetical protein
MASTGAEGGLYAVLKEVAATMASGFAKNEIAAKVNHYWNDLTTEERLAAPDEYLAKYAGVIPPGYEWQIRARFPDVLRNHPRMIQRLEQAGRR